MQRPGYAARIRDEGLPCSVGARPRLLAWRRERRGVTVLVAACLCLMRMLSSLIKAEHYCTARRAFARGEDECTPEENSIIR
jgi:hypothetical protein